jgi:hypothetical protein
MTWMSSSACQGNRRYECYYETFYGSPNGGSWCEDHDDYCPSWSRGAPLVSYVDHNAPDDGW